MVGKNDIKLKNLNKKWIQKFGINFGTAAKDWLDKELNYQDLAPFLECKIIKKIISNLSQFFRLLL